MTIDINEKYQIDIDKDQYILKGKRVSQGKKTGGELILTEIGYFNTLEGAIKDIIHRNIASNESKVDLVEFLKLYKEEVHKFKNFPV